jgi:PAS domain S-box-containing protein
MADTAQARAEAALRRDATLEAIAFAAQRFLETPDWEQIAPQVLRRLGEATAVSRIVIFRNDTTDDGRRHAIAVQEWVATGISAVTHGGVVSGIGPDGPGFERWVGILGRGDLIVGHARDLPETERRLLEGMDVRSVLVVPIFVGREWWGHISADDASEEREWSQVEIDALRAAAGTIAAAIQRRHAEEQLRQAEERFRLIVERTPAITYQEIASEGLTAASSVIYVSPQVERILGYPVESWQVPGFWTQIVHPDDLERVIADGERVMARGDPWFAEYRMLAADGRVVWFRDESVLVRDEAGHPRFWHGVMIDITLRKQVEEQLQKTEAQFRALVEHIPAVTYRQALDGNPEQFYISPQVGQMFGYTPEQWAWTPNFWYDRIHPDDLPRVVEIDQATDETAEPFDEEYRFRRADGEYVWVHDQATAVPLEGGPPFWQGFIQGITERKRAEEALREAEAQFRALVEHIPAVTYREGIVATAETLYLSPQVAGLFGYDPQEWRGTPYFWRDHIHPDDLETVTEANARANATGEPYLAEYRFRRADGSYVWVHDEATRIEEVDGPPFWQGFIQDITERKQAEEALREAEARFRALVEQVPAAIYTQVIDEEDSSISKTVYISPQTEPLLGYSVEETLADPTLWRKIVHPDDQERVAAEDAATNESGDPFRSEYRVIARDGHEVWIRDEATLIRDMEGRPRFWQGFMLDVTERKRAEEQLEHALEVEREATGRLRALDEMKNTFLQAVSHDLRTPLAAILGLAVTLERADLNLEPAEAQDLARRIATNARKLDRMVTDLLDLDRLARGIVEPKLHPTDVGALVRRVVGESDLLEQGRVTVEAPPLVATVDASKVERIVENLLANTMRHTPTDTRVWVRVEPADGGLIIAVEDDGPGVPAVHRAEIFEPFRQGPDAPDHSPGVGVGLTLVARFAELLGGHAWVQDREGGGASFRVYLADGPRTTARVGAAG